MKIAKIQPAGFASNTFAITQDGKSCVLIDCSHETILDDCDREGLVPEYILLTHGHFDHIGGCARYAERGVKICCGEAEKDLIFSDGYASIFGVPIERFPIYRTFKDGDELELCGIKIKVIATPGHTAGSVSYLIGDCLFVGDTLFHESVGRCDLPTGDGSTLVNSIKRLYALEGDCKIYCGHGGETTLSHERAHNLYVRK